MNHKILTPLSSFRSQKQNLSVFLAWKRLGGLLLAGPGRPAVAAGGAAGDVAGAALADHGLSVVLLLLFMFIVIVA